MRKIAMLLFACALALIGLSRPVFAYEPHSMPGGKNYLATSNFAIVNNQSYSLDAIMVKPNTHYALAVKMIYKEAGGEVLIDFLVDGAPYSQATYIDTDFIDPANPDYSYITFKTPPTVNYLHLLFRPGGDFFAYGNPGQFQLEEGTFFTNYEVYTEGTIFDTVGPVFIGMSKLYSNVDNPLLMADILAAFTAHDAVDGDVTADIEVVFDEYSSNRMMVGLYQIILEASDSSGNRNQVTFRVQVVDITDPMITGPAEIVVAYPNVRTLQSIQNEFSWSDNYASEQQLTLEVVGNEYAGNEDALGRYAIVLRVTDNSGNATDKTVYIHVLDQADPIITGPAVMSLGYHLTMSATEILDLFHAQDNHDGDVTAQLTLLSNAYATHQTVIGSYQVVVGVEDSSGNLSTHTLTVNVVDLIGPIVYFDTSVIAVYNNAYLLLSDITKLLIRSEVLANRDYAVRVVFDSYTRYARVPGTYHMKLEYEDEANQITTHNLQIVVRLAPSDFLPKIDEPSPAIQPSFWAKFGGWFGTGFFFLAAGVSNLIWWKMSKKK
ncbi:MAG: hypothetical protein MZU97_22125 [Bacillus subtilis]|nr:hypothetical protein [Bacillus subtilis]